MDKKFCRICKKQIIAIPFVGEKYHEFEDGFYCEKCAKIVVDRRRRKA